MIVSCHHRAELAGCWLACLSKLYTRPNFIHFEDVPLVEFTYLVFTRMPGSNYRRRFRSLLLCPLLYLWRLSNAVTSLCWFQTASSIFLFFFFGGYWPAVCPRKEAGDVWCLPPVLNLRAVIWFHFAISFLVLLLSPITLSDLYFYACWSILLNFFPENSSIFFVQR